MSMLSRISLKKVWDKSHDIPKGKEMVAKIIGVLAPYTGTLNLKIRTLTDKQCIVVLKDRRTLRNHLSSIHAAALMNFSESASGLLLNYSIPESHRSILVKFEIEYLKKARGTLTAECSLPKAITFDGEEKIVLQSLVKNEQGDVVSKSHAHWLVRPKK